MLLSCTFNYKCNKYNNLHQIKNRQTICPISARTVLVSRLCPDIPVSQPERPG